MPSSEEKEIERLKDRIEELEELLGMKLEPPHKIRSKHKAFWPLVGLLLKRRRVSREFAYRALYGGRLEADQPKSLRMIDTNIMRANKVLREYDIVVKAEPGFGYFLEDEDHSALTRLVNVSNKR